MTELALLECVVSHPDEDLPRLVLADWWEENGQPERGEFVRVQVELAAAVPPTGVKDRPADLLGGQGRVFHKRGRESAWGKRQAFLRQRDRELFDAHAVAWKLGAGLNLPVEVVFSRGFISTLTCSATDFLRVERALLWPPETMKCPKCMGKRQSPTYAPVRDIVCSGCGATFEARPDGSKWCPRCWWSRPPEHDGYERCRKCKGAGRIALPRPTDVCPACAGAKGRVNQSGGYIEFSGPHPTWEKCVQCDGSGTIPRPFAATCQPITAVRFTTDIREHVEQSSGRVRFTGRQ